MAEDYFLKTNLDNESEIKRKDFEPAESYIRSVHEQKRKDKHENVKHLLAGIIIIPYILLLLVSGIWGFEIPKAYEIITLIIIGYYFAKNFEF